MEVDIKEEIARNRKALPITLGYITTNHVGRILPTCDQVAVSRFQGFVFGNYPLKVGWWKRMKPVARTTNGVETTNPMFFRAGLLFSTACDHFDHPISLDYLHGSCCSFQHSSTNYRMKGNWQQSTHWRTKLSGVGGCQYFALVDLCWTSSKVGYVNNEFMAIRWRIWGVFFLGTIIFTRSLMVNVGPERFAIRLSFFRGSQDKTHLCVCVGQNWASQTEE